MLDALISGKLIKDAKAGTSGTGTKYTQFLLSVPCGEPQNIVVSGVAFGELAERIAKLQKGDSLAVIGSLKPTEWQDKATGETKHGMNITASNSLSVYDIKSRKPDESKPQKEVIRGGSDGYEEYLASTPTGEPPGY
jgi:single-stranded DNA-binding protein